MLVALTASCPATPGGAKGSFKLEKDIETAKEGGGDQARAGRTIAPADRTTEKEKKPLPQRARDLMIAALGLFARRDFSAVTIKDIASSAGVNTALIYYYFDNKEDLFRATLEYAVERALENYRRLGERHSDPVDLINDWFDNHAELSEPIRQLVKIMLDHRTARTQLTVVDDIIKQFYDEECAIISSSVSRGIASGVFRKVDPEKAAHLASTHLDGIMVRSIIHRDLDVVAAIAALQSLFFEHLGYRADEAAALGSTAPRIASAS